MRNPDTDGALFTICMLAALVALLLIGVELLRIYHSIGGPA